MAPETGPHRKCINMRLMFGTWGHNVTLLTRPDGQNFLNLNVLDILSDLMNAAGKQKLYDLHAIVVMCRKSRKRKPTVNNVDSIQKTRLKAAWSQPYYFQSLFNWTNCHSILKGIAEFKIQMPFLLLDDQGKLHLLPHEINHDWRDQIFYP